MKSISLISVFSVIGSSIAFGISCVVAAVLLVRHARARQDAEILKQGISRLSQQDIDCARS
jgi:hypothetical protein